jgi:hypothetical protein
MADDGEKAMNPTDRRPWLGALALAAVALAGAAPAVCSAAPGAEPAERACPGLVQVVVRAAVATHEMAHAVVGCHAGPLDLPVAAHECVAYVALFATMEPRLRARLLARFSGTGFSSTLEINDMNHFANSNQFGVDAWRDYLRRQDRDAWLREVIAGRVVETWPTDGP